VNWLTKEVKMNAQTTDRDHDSSSRDGQRRVRLTTLILLIIIALLFIWYMVADRLTPYTASARMQAFVVAVVPDVSGFITEIPVKKNQLAETGDTLLQIETGRFEIAVEAAEAELELAGQDVGADTAAVATAAAKLAAARVALEQAQVQGARVFKLVEKGAFPKAKGDEWRGIVATAQAGVTEAEAELERAKQQLGSGDDADNPRVRRALAGLEQARLNLLRTTLTAPTRGYIGGLKIDEGSYVNAGQPAMTFISVDDIWVEALMTENNLGRIELGDKVELAFDAFPGEIFEGKVKSVAVGVSTGKATNLGDLPTVEKTRGWLRDPQRFPVVIETTNYKYDVNTVLASGLGLRHNSQADVIVYTGDHFFWNTLGKFWIRLMSLLSYAY
jgi:multidrug resistance efflux pump